MALPNLHPRRNKVEAVRISDSLYACQLCDTTMKSRSEIDIHVIDAHNVSRDGPLQCIYCNKFFSSMATRREHVGDEHGFVIDVTLSCPHCSSPCLGSAFLEIHAEVHRAERSKESKYFCPLCPSDNIQTFSSSAYLKLHMTREHFAPFANTCMECGFMFRFAEKLHDHYEIQHKSDEHSSFNTKDARCTKCRRIFPNQVDLQHHLAICDIKECKFCYCLSSIHNPSPHECGSSGIATGADLCRQSHSTISRTNDPRISGIKRTNMPQTTSGCSSPRKMAKRSILIENSSSENEDSGAELFPSLTSPKKPSTHDNSN